MLDATLIPLPMQAINPDRQSHITNAGNKRFSHGEKVVFKHAMCKQKMLELGTVCRNWRSAASEMYPRDYFLIGERQVKFAAGHLLQSMPALRELFEPTKQISRHLMNDGRSSGDAGLGPLATSTWAPNHDEKSIASANGDGRLCPGTSLLDNTIAQPSLEPYESRVVISTPTGDSFRSQVEESLIIDSPADIVVTPASRGTKRHAMAGQRAEAGRAAHAEADGDDAQAREAWVQQFMNREYSKLDGSDIGAYTPINLTVCCALRTLLRLFGRLRDSTCERSYRGIQHPRLRIERLTILHSFAPEILGIDQPQCFFSHLGSIVVEELSFEAYTGGHILAVRSLDEIAKRLNIPMTDEEYGRDVSRDLNPIRTLTIKTIDRAEELFSARSQHVEPSEAAQMKWYCGLHESGASIAVMELCHEPNRTSLGRPATGPFVATMFDGQHKNRLPWNELNAMAGMLLRGLLAMWKHDLKKLEITAHWQDLQNVSINYGSLRQFDYHYVPLNPHSVVRSYRPKIRDGAERASRPLGAMKALDNIVMWDLRSRLPKWQKRKMRRQAIADHVDFVDPRRTTNLEWNIHVPYDLWVEQKKQTDFKGFGAHAPWRYNARAELDAIANFVLLRLSRYRVPQAPFTDDVDQTQACLLMTEQALERRKFRPGDFVQNRHLLHFTGGETIDKEWLEAHMAAEARWRRWEEGAEARQAEEEFNMGPDGVDTQDRFNRYRVPFEIVAAATRTNLRQIDGLHAKLHPPANQQHLYHISRRTRVRGERVMEILSAINQEFHRLPAWRQNPAWINGSTETKQEYDPGVAIRRTLVANQSYGLSAVLKAVASPWQATWAVNDWIFDECTHFGAADLEVDTPALARLRQKSMQLAMPYPFVEGETTAELSGFEYLLRNMVRAYGAKELFNNCNWPLWHPAYPDVRVMVDDRTD